jgi:hemin uptake protein HemP
MLRTPPKPRPETAVPPTNRVQSQSLLGAGRELVILHNGREYRLGVTQNGKLILTA